MVPTSNKEELNIASAAKALPVIPSYGLPKEAAPITSTHNIRLRMNPASKLHGIPGERLNVSMGTIYWGFYTVFILQSYIPNVFTNFGLCFRLNFSSQILAKMAILL